jgi:hypothetical protein
MNTPISFPIAKLLKEKGFDDECKYYYDENEELTFHIGYIGDIWRNSEIKDGLPYTKEKSPCISAPTIAHVVMWLYEKHGIWIYSYPVQPLVLDDEEYPKTVWVVKCLSMNQIMFEKFIDAKNCLAINHHASPTDAYESAFEYALNNLI